MIRFLKISILFIALLLPAQSFCAPPDAKTIKRQQQNTRKAIEKDSRKLEKNKKEISRQIKQLSQLEKEIGAQSHEIDQLQQQVNSTNASIAVASRQIDSLNMRMKSLRENYTKSVRRMQTLPTEGGPFAYILGAPSLKQAMQRARYLRQFNKWNREREQEIVQASALLSQKHRTLSMMQDSVKQNLDIMATRQASLKQKQNKTDNMIGQLKRESGTLESAISRRRKQLANLDAELNRIIEADRRVRQQKAKEKEKQAQTARQPSNKTGNKTTAPVQTVTDPDSKLTGSFEANKGRMLFPVTGTYRVVRGFGKSNYSARVQTSHVGIDLQTPAGATARAIFNGQVTNVSRLDGFNTIVVIRHGQYLSVYINLSSASVKTGQEVKAGQTIGTVATDPNDSSHAILQFGLRKDRTELNPLNWVKN